MTRATLPGVVFSSAREPRGLRIEDAVDNYQYHLRTPTPVDPTPAPVERFDYPVDAATRIRTSAIEFPTPVAVHARDEAGGLVASVEHLNEVSLGPGTYTLEPLVPVKCYFEVTGPVDLQVDFAETRIEFDGEQELLVGGRSRRSRPAATVTTTTDPADLLATVSTFGSALGSTMPERSYPSLRGHPPAVTVGDELDTKGLTAPATDVRLALPETVEAALTAAPLAYYLGAPVTATDGPARLLADGMVHRLGDPRTGSAAFERGVERTLKTVFFMDCLTRFDGAYGHGRRLQERELLTGQLDVDFAALYDADHAERVRRYLSVPYETIEPYLPKWKVATHVRPAPRNVETLPFLVDDLALVRMSESTTDQATAGQQTELASFLAGPESGEATRADHRSTGTGDTLTRGTTADGSTADRDRSFVSPDPADAIEQVWVGDAIPFGASEALTTAYRNRLDREPGDGEIDITVVCNEAAMDEEADVEAVYGQREHLEFDVGLRRDLRTDELRALLAEDHDFLHYIGHAEPDGLVCEDGKVDCRTLEDAGVDAFFLNACRSYEQARGLIETGAIVGIGSHTDVTNASAVGLGRMMGRLLERGFPFRAALELAREEHPIGEQYVVVGDGGLSITQSETRTALLAELERSGEDRYELTLQGFPTEAAGLGGGFIPYLVQAENTYYLSSGEIDTFELSTDELSEYLGIAPIPVRLDGELTWSDAIDLER